MKTAKSMPSIFCIFNESPILCVFQGKALKPHKPEVEGSSPSLDTTYIPY